MEVRADAAARCSHTYGKKKQLGLYSSRDSVAAYAWRAQHPPTEEMLMLQVQKAKEGKVEGLRLR